MNAGDTPSFPCVICDRPAPAIAHLRPDGVLFTPGRCRKHAPSPAQARILRAIRAWRRLHCFPPTRRELAEGLGLSIKAVAWAIDRLRAKRCLSNEVKGRARALVLLEEGLP